MEFDECMMVGDLEFMFKQLCVYECWFFKNKFSFYYSILKECISRSVIDYNIFYYNYLCRDKMKFRLMEEKVYKIIVIDIFVVDKRMINCVILKDIKKRKVSYDQYCINLKRIGIQMLSLVS